MRQAISTDLFVADKARSICTQDGSDRFGQLERHNVGATTMVIAGTLLWRFGWHFQREFFNFFTIRSSGSNGCRRFVNIHNCFFDFLLFEDMLVHLDRFLRGSVTSPHKCFIFKHLNQSYVSHAPSSCTWMVLSMAEVLLEWMKFGIYGKLLLW